MSDRPASVGDLATVGGELPPATRTLTPGDAPPGYVIEGELGRGGMGVVYAARQVGLNRPVALKMVLGSTLAGSRELIRFLAEAEAVASVRHPHVVEVYQFGDHAGRPFLAMEYCPGHLPEPGGEPFEVVAGVMSKIAAGVGAAHAAGIVHRDLKPGNVLLSEAGEPKVTDFGLAKRVAGDSELTRTNAVMGTPAYMAPEQAQGGTKFVGPPADVWALGVMLYERLTGRRPFLGDDNWQLLAAVQAGDFPPPRTVNPQVPKDLDLICRKCLSREPRERYETASELSADLRRWRAGEPISARPPTRVERTRRWVRKHPVRAVAVLAAGALAGLGVWFNEQKYAIQREQVRVVEAAEKEARGAAEAAQVAAAEARREKAGADAARTAADGEKRNAQAAREAAVDGVYAAGIDLAYREWEQNNVYRSEQLLSDSPPDRRGWEWRFLSSLTKGTARVLHGHLRGCTTWPSARTAAGWCRSIRTGR